MATLKEMVDIAGSIEKAEEMARGFIDQYGESFLLDLELLLSIQGRDEEAKAVNRRILKNNPNDHRALFNKAWDLLREGHLIEGYQHLEAGRTIGVYAKPDIRTNQPRWDGKAPIGGKTVLFHCECGLGDEIMQVRFVRELIARGARVIVGCSSSLMTVFNRLPGIQAVVDKEASGAVHHDYWIPSMNAVNSIGVTYETLSGKPYLTPDPKYVEKWRKMLPAKALKVGIRWAGNICYEQELFRTLPAMDLIRAVDIPGVQLYSLQRDDDRIELPENVIDLADFMNTWEDTAGIMANLDLVISSCTSVPHFAGALGIPTWVVVAVANYYSWALPKPEGGTPWYDTVTVFRQKTFQDWSAPLAEVSTKLQELICRG